MDKPLAYRMRPTNLDEVIGQEHLVGEGKILRRMIKANRVVSMILSGPPGIGKTSIAKAIAGSSGMPYFELNAVSSGKKDIEKVAIESEGKIALLYIDEIHRFSRVQQDSLLPLTENGSLVLVASTTESVMHEVVPALRSRCQLFELKPLEPKEIRMGLEKALKDKDKGLGDLDIEVTEDAFLFFENSSSGDLRAALNALEIAALSTEPDENRKITITLKDAEDSIQKKSYSFDKDGNFAYNCRSAYQKSIRGSDVTAALWYAALMIEAGDLKTLIRRSRVVLYEDCGLATGSDVITSVSSALDDAEKIGLPEARIPLSYAIITMCMNPKSNSAYKALDKAIARVKQGNIGNIPEHLQDSHYAGAKSLGKGVGYIYPHDYDGFVQQQYLPDNIKDIEFYEPKFKGKEKLTGEFYKRIKELQKNND